MCSLNRLGESHRRISQEDRRSTVMAEIFTAVEIIDADDYNSIPLFEHQKHDISPDDLQGIGNIFFQHGYLHDFSICSKHRHFELSPRTIMVYSKRSDGLIKCNIEALETLPAVFPRSISLKTEESSPSFEYALDPPKTYPRSDFIRELTRFLRHRNLEDVLALSLRAPSEVLYEMSLEQEPGLVYLLKHNVERDGDTVVTGWRFEVQDGEVVTLPCQTCQDKGGGRHHDPDANKKNTIANNG